MTARDDVLARIRTALGRTPLPPQHPVTISGEDGAPATAPPATAQGATHPPATAQGATHPPATAPGTAHPPATGATAGTHPGTSADIPRRYRMAGSAGGPELLDLLAERLADYHARVRRCTPDRLTATAARALTERGARRVVLPPGLDLPGLAPLLPGTGLVTDDGLSPAQLDSFDGVVTGAAVAVAETGTIVLDGSAGQGRRAISLIPDYHLCLVHAGQVVALLPEALARLTPGRPLTWISGPSATSDIELDRVEGVHGPRTLEVILIEPG